MWPIGGRASVSEPTDEGESEQHNNKDFDKGCHDTIDVFNPQQPCSSWCPERWLLAIPQ